MNTSKLLALPALAFALQACQTTPPEVAQAALRDARQTVSQARSHPQAARAASLEVAQAEETLKRAERAWQESHDSEEARHLAYLARQRAQLALNLAEQRRAEEQLADSATERQRIQAEAQALQAQQGARMAQAGAVQAQQRADALSQELQALKARQTDKGLVVALPDVLFDSGKAALKPHAQQVVTQLADVMAAHPERRLRLEGFTDSLGSEAANQVLAERRAEALRGALVEQGVPPQRLEIKAWGESQPIASNDTPEGRQQNRRVEVVFSDEQGQFAAP